MDSQIVELLGRNRLVDELLMAGLEVALPARDRGIDLIAYADVDTKVDRFIARPIQMKAASGRSFSVHAKYAKFPDMLLAYVWNLAGPDNAVTYAMTYTEAVAIADAMGWTKTASWERGGYSINGATTKLLGLLEPHRMTPRKWWRKVTETAVTRTDGPDIDGVWERIVRRAGETFCQVRGGEFAYEVHGNFLHLDRTNQSIPKSLIAQALAFVPMENTTPVQHLRAPSYLYAILMDPRIRAGEW